MGDVWLWKHLQKENGEVIELKNYQQHHYCVGQQEPANFPCRKLYNSPDPPSTAQAAPSQTCDAFPYRLWNDMGKKLMTIACISRYNFYYGMTYYAF